MCCAQYTSPPINATIILEVSKGGDVYVGVYVVAGGVTVVGLVTVYACVRTHYAGQPVAGGAHGAGVVVAGAASIHPLRRAESLLPMASSTSR